MARITKETKTVSDGYSREDRETTLNYDYENQEWIAYSSVPTHITRMTKLYGDDVEVLERLESGTAVLVRAKNDQKDTLILFRINNIRRKKHEL
ncbi:hypothetical protein I4654_03510 [Staphylococcus aureus]|nr:hypothetical protein [Staphylococcus aureus]